VRLQEAFRGRDSPTLAYPAAFDDNGRSLLVMSEIARAAVVLALPAASHRLNTGDKNDE
jgi:hypothetical protein